MLKKHNPATVASPLSAYSHGVEVPPNARWMCLSGQIAIAPDGSVLEGIDAQARLVFENIKNILASGDMSLEDLVRLNVYIVNPDDMPGFRTPFLWKTTLSHCCSCCPMMEAMVFEGKSVCGW